MQPIYKPGFSVENKNKILSESDIKTVQEMNSGAKNVKVTAIFNSKKAKVIIKKLEKNSKPKKVKIAHTLKPKHFSETGDISEESFENLLKKLVDINHAEFVAKKISFESVSEAWATGGCVNDKRIKKREIDNPYEAEEIVNHQESTESNCKANPALQLN